MVDQTPIGKSPRSNPVTYVKAFDPIRELLASTHQAQVRGYQGRDVLVQRPRWALRGVPG